MTVNFNCGNNFLSFPSSLLKRSLHLMRRENVDLERGGGEELGGGQMEEREKQEEAYHTPMTVPRLFCFDKTKTTPREGTLDKTLK